MMVKENDEPTSEEILNQYENTPEYKLKQSDQEEKLDDDNFDMQQGYGYPEPTVKENLFTFWKWFFDIIDKFKLNKTGNLETHELENVRMYEDLANYVKIDGDNGIIASYFNEKSAIVLSTSLSKKGFGAGLVGTQVRKVQRMTTGQRTKQGLFSKKTEETTESE
jgi:hypothetical protein